VLYEKQERIAHVTLNRPEAKNAIDQATHEALCRAWEGLRRRRGRRRGDPERRRRHLLPRRRPEELRAAQLRRGDPGAGAGVVGLGLGGITRGIRVRKPVIAAVDGWALAGGLELALACDLRIASERARFGSFEARRGFHHGDGGISRLVGICGTGVAMQMVLTAEPIDAERALACNLVSKVVPQDELMAAAEEIAGQILRNSQRAVRSAKETILEVVGKPLGDQLRLEGWSSYSCLDPQEARDLLGHFYERTDPGRPS
jgi:enoyl-CoA hydratase/carnithine racemase